MRTSLNEIKEIEKFLHHQLDAEESLVFEARLLTNPMLKLNTYLQQKIGQLLLIYHRKKLKEEAETVHQRLFSDPEKADFQQTIMELFKH